MLARLRKLCSTETNIMLVGAAGCGKSSTINALFSCNRQEEYVEAAKVGSRADPETRDIERCRIGNLILWDTPGPEIDGDTDRILAALNQADIAMKTGRHWDYEKNEPDETLTKFLEEMVISIGARIKEDTGLTINPVYYCAGYEEEAGDVVHPYNLSKLLYYILNALPAEKRAAVFGGINTDARQYEYDDGGMDYKEGVMASVDGMADYVAEGINNGAVTGFCILGAPGALVGSIVEEEDKVMLMDLLFEGVIRGSETVSDILEFGPLEAFSINTAGVPEAKRAERRICKTMDEYISSLQSSYDECDEEETDDFEEDTENGGNQSPQSSSNERYYELLRTCPFDRRGAFGRAAWILNSDHLAGYDEK